MTLHTIWAAVTSAVLPALVAALGLGIATPAAVHAKVGGHTGAYNTPGTPDLSRTGSVGITLGTATYLKAKAAGDKAAAAIEASGIQVLDTTPLRILYSNEPALDTCDEKVATMESVRRRAPLVAGFILTDDHRADGPTRTCIRRVAATLGKPTVCPMQLDVPTDQRSARSVVRRFKLRGSSYFAAGYCDWAAFYSYVRKGETNPRWAMPWVFRQAKAHLVRRGWTGRLIGIPQTFGDTEVHAETTSYHLPSPAEIGRQVAAFCRQGARTLLGYAWTDTYHAAGRKGLSNDATILAAYRRAAACLG